ncbi:MAG TPA: gamma-glutamyltransferase [Acidimicrobiales bacterium]
MTRAVVAGGHRATCEAALRVLDAGGNAFDAIVAAGFASATSEPLMTGLGGGGFCLTRTAAGEATLFDFFVDTPGRGLDPMPEPHFFPVAVRYPGVDQVFNTGMGSAAVPGTVNGYLAIHERLGRLPLAEVVAPAIELAREGVVLDEFHGSVSDLLWPILVLTEDGRRLFGVDGEPQPPGHRFTNPDTGRFLAELQADPRHGLWSEGRGDQVVREMAAGEGLITAEDLAAYAVAEREPLAVRYRDRTVLTNPPPAFGGELIGRGLGFLAEDLPTPGAWGDPGHLTALGRALQDLEASRVPPDGPRFSRGTTHASVADAEGNVASLSTSNGEASGYVVPGTGVMLNNMLGEDDLHPDGFHASPPGVRVSSMMAPTVVLGPDGVELVLGSGGSARIRTAILQTVSGVVDFGLDPADAVSRPRIHWDGAAFQVEPGFAAESVAALAVLGPINPWSDLNLYFGGVHAVAPDGHGSGDPRRAGACLSQ